MLPTDKYHVPVMLRSKKLMPRPLHSVIFSNTISSFSMSRNTRFDSKLKNLTSAEDLGILQGDERKYRHLGSAETRQTWINSRNSISIIVCNIALFDDVELEFELQDSFYLVGRIDTRNKLLPLRFVIVLFEGKQIENIFSVGGKVPTRKEYDFSGFQHDILIGDEFQDSIQLEDFGLKFKLFAYESIRGVLKASFLGKKSPNPEPCYWKPSKLVYSEFLNMKAIRIPRSLRLLKKKRKKDIIVKNAKLAPFLNPTYHERKVQINAASHSARSCSVKEKKEYLLTSRKQRFEQNMDRHYKATIKVIKFNNI